MLSERERLPVRSVVFVLTPERYREQHGTFQLAVGGEPTQQVWFREICMWKEKPEPWWEQAPGLMAMLPLCDHGRSEAAAVVYAARTLTSNVKDTIIRSNMLAILAFFGKLASPDVGVLNLIGRENMRESKFFEEVMAEGKIEAKRSDVLQVLELRFGPDAAAEYADAITLIRDEQLLTEIHGLAVKSRGLGGFRRAFASRWPQQVPAIQG